MTFATTYTVPIADINYGGHLGNDRPLALFHEARVQLLKSLGYTEIDIGEGRGIIMVESGVRYLKEVFHNDLLQIEVAVSELAEKKFVLDYQIARLPAREPVLAGFTVFLGFDYEKRAVARLPEPFSEALRVFQNDVS
jgi:acyl-CoA thioester hydrolase